MITLYALTTPMVEAGSILMMKLDIVAVAVAVSSIPYNDPHTLEKPVSEQGHKGH